MSDDAGWIKLSRKLLQSKYYLGEKFTRAMCWIDLLLLAEWRNERSFFHRGIEVVVKRGQVAISLDDLHKRWQLSVNTVRSRLSEMKKDGRIDLETNNVISKITILNYEKYQGVDYAQDQDTIRECAESVVPSVAQTPFLKEEPTNETQVEIHTEPTAIVPDLPATQQKPQVDCDFVLKLYHHICQSLPKVLKLSDKRKSKIRIRFEEMGQDYQVMQEVFEKAEASNFLRGDNHRGWHADFDWIFTNGQNWVKILEGKYDNKPQTEQNRYETQQTDRYAKRRGADSTARTAEDYSDSI